MWSVRGHGKVNVHIEVPGRFGHEESVHVEFDVAHAMVVEGAI